MMQNPLAKYHKQLIWKLREKIFFTFEIVETDFKDLKLLKHFFFNGLIPSQTNAMKIGYFELKIKLLRIKHGN